MKNNQSNANKAVAIADIKQYLKESSDFSFEMAVLNALCDLGFTCEHSGTYSDPVTGKYREFDIVAKLGIENTFYSFSVECKNLKVKNPLVVHSVPRTDENYFHTVMFYPKKSNSKPNWNALDALSSGDRLNIEEVFVCGEEVNVCRNGYVGKSMDQFSYNGNGDLKASDANLYDKMTQALSVSSELIDDNIWLSNNGSGKLFIVQPVLVVPDNTLFEIKYDKFGTMGSIDSVHRVQYYVNRRIKVGYESTPFYSTILHLEIMSFSELKNYFINAVSESGLKPSQDYISRYLADKRKKMMENLTKKIH